MFPSVYVQSEIVLQVHADIELNNVMRNFLLFFVHIKMYFTITYLGPCPYRKLCNLYCVPVHHKYFTTHYILILTKFLNGPFEVFVVWELKLEKPAKW